MQLKAMSVSVSMIASCLLVSEAFGQRGLTKWNWSDDQNLTGDLSKPVPGTKVGDICLVT